MLPCDDSICREHLSESDVINENRIKCKECSEEFQVKCDEFRTNKTLNKQVVNQSYLSEDEMSLKHDLDESIRKLFQSYDEFNQNKTIRESLVTSQFEEIRSQIDQHRDKLKERIDAIALKIKDETKFYEAMYLKSLKESFTSFDQGKSLENELNEIEYTFRDPNLLIETIREMQQKKEESLNEIQSKLNEINQVKDNLKSIPEFQPNLSLFNQRRTSLFGSFKLQGYSSMNSLKSEILIDGRQCSELIDICEFSPNDKWSLLYRGTRDGFGTKAFHSECDSHANTLTLLKAKGSGFIFGGYTTVSWDSLSGDKSDANAFIFSLTNGDNEPLKMKINPNDHEFAIRCNPGYGPVFGGGFHIAKPTMDSYSYLGHTYSHPQYAYQTNEASTFLAGSSDFQLDEIEVYQKD